MSKILLPIILLWNILTEYVYFDKNTDKTFFFDLGSFSK